MLLLRYKQLVDRTAHDRAGFDDRFLVQNRVTDDGACFDDALIHDDRMVDRRAFADCRLAADDCFIDAAVDDRAGRDDRIFHKRFGTVARWTRHGFFGEYRPGLFKDLIAHLGFEQRHVGFEQRLWRID